MIVVLGMHRSGTSPLTRLLAMCGADLGPVEELVAAAPDNPRGFWENRRLVEMNERLLSAFGGTSSSPPEFPEGWVRDDRTEPVRREARRALESCFPGPAPGLWKDPRTCLTFDFWKDLLPEAAVVLAIRNPLETAKSLEKRDGMPVDIAMCLWELYVRGTLASVGELPWTVARFEDVLADPVGEARRLAGFLRGCGMDGVATPDAATVRAFVRPDLRHAVHGTDDLEKDPRVTVEQVALYAHLLRMAKSEAGPADPPPATPLARRVLELYRSDVALSEARRELRAEHEHFQRESLRWETLLEEQRRSIERSEAERSAALADLWNITGSKAWNLARRLQAGRRAVTDWKNRGSVRRALFRPGGWLWQRVEDARRKRRTEQALQQVLGGRGAREETLRWFRTRRTAATGDAKSAVLNRPLVNVIVTCHDDAEYLPDMLESLRHQTLQRFHLTLVDDASTDPRSLDVLEELERTTSPEVTVLRLAENAGPAAARNRGLEATDASVPYITCVDADDVLHPQFLERTVGLLEGNPSLGTAYFDYQYFGDADDIVNAPEYDLPALLQENFMVACSVYRRDLWEQAGGYDEDMRSGYEDWELWIRVAKAGWFGQRLPEVLFFYRRRQGSVSKKAWAAKHDLVRYIREKHSDLYAPERLAGIGATWAAAATAPMVRPAPPVSPSPLVSVVVPCFNQGDTVVETIDSVLSQAYTHIETVVVDDGSTDEFTVERLRELEGRGIRVLHQENAGLASARNAGVRAAHGELILPLDSDDVILPELVERCVSVFREESDVGFVYPDIVFFGDENGVHSQEEFDAGLELTNNHVTVCAMYRKSDWETAGGYNPNMKQGMEDWDFWVSMVEHGCFGRLIPTPLFGYRVRGGSMSQRMLPHVPRLVSRLRANHEGLYRPAVVRALRKQSRPGATAWKRFPARPADPAGDMEPVTGRDVRVSVIVPVHGHDRYFDGCLRSVLERQDQDLELVLVDDASRSEEIERLLHRAEADPRCRVLRNRENVGISRTLNRGIAAATGTHFAFLDCDDELVEGALGRIVEVVRAEGTHYLSTQIEDIDHEGRVIDTRPREETPEDLMRGNFAGHLKVISRRVFERVGPFDPAVDGCQDYDLALRCAEVFPLRFLPDALYRYRWHTGTISVKREAEQEALAERVRRRARLRRFLADESVQKGGLFGIEVLLLGAEAVEPPLPRSFETRVTRIDGSWESGRDDLASLGEAERERLAAIGEAEGPPMVLLVAEGGSLDAADVVSLVARLSEEPGRRAVVPAPAGRLPSFVSGPGAVHAEGVLLERSVLTLLRDPAALRDVVENEAPCVEWGWGVEAQPVPERDPVRPLD